jgi:Flp pilus assembly protein TadD
MASLRKLRKLAKKNPRDPAAWYELGIAAMEEGEVVEGQEALRISLALVPPAPIALSLGRIFQDLGRPGEALRAFRRAAELEPQSVEACTQFGLALCQSGDRDWGLEQLRRAADLQPNEAEPQYVLATHLLAAGRREQALGALRKAISIVPSHQPSLALLGRCRREDGDVDEAKAALEKAVMLNPSDTFARVDLGVVLCKTDQREAGFRCFREALNRSPQSGELLVKVATATHEIGDLGNAIRYLREAVRVAPKLVEAHALLGQLLLEEGSMGAAVVALARAVELAPRSDLYLYHLGVAYQRCGDLVQAERSFTEAAVLVPEDEEIQARLREVQALQIAATRAPRVTGPLPRVEPVDRSNAAMVGALEDFALPDLLQLLRGVRRTGVLYLSAGDLTGEVTMLEGAIASATSPSAGLGDILMDHHGITHEQLREVVSLQREGSPKSVGELLVERGHLDRERLKQAMESQIKLAIAEIVSWKEGRFAFEPLKDEPSEAQLSLPRLDVDRVLLDVLA